MFRPILFVACSVLLMQSIWGYSINYRCAANGCLNSAECQSDGSCSCSGTQFGTYCDVSKACAAGTTCTAANTITNAGTPANICYDSADTKCICKDGYTGILCDKKILDVTCSATAFEFTITPHRYSDLNDFSGEIYFAHESSAFDDLSKITHANCKKDATPYTMNAFTATAADCGVAPVVGTNGKKFYAYIKHNKKIKSVEDQVIEVICDPDNTQKSVSITNTIVAPSKEIQQTTVSKVDDVIMKIRKDGGKTLTDFQVHDTVRVNDNIALTLESKSKFYIKDCKVNDGTTAVSIDLIDATGCVTNEGLLLYSSEIIAVPDSSTTATDYTDHGLTGDPNKNAVKLPLKAFKFTSGSKIAFTCELCMESGCKGGTHNPCTKNLHIGSELEKFQAEMHGKITRRRRRSVTNGTVGTSISVALTVDEYKELLKEANESKETECFKSAVVLLPLILLASLLVIAMGMTFFFCNKFTKNMTEGQSNIGFKA